MFIGDRLSASSESFAQHLHELHEHIKMQIAISNNNYKSTADSHKRLQEFAIGDGVMISVHSERFLLGTLKKLHARCMNPYRVLRRLVPMLMSSTSPLILESTRCSTLRIWLFTTIPVAYPTAILNEPALTLRSPQPFLVQPPILPPLRRPSIEEIEGILTDETVSTAAGTYQCYLVCWRGRPDSIVLGCRPRRSCNST